MSARQNILLFILNVDGILKVQSMESVPRIDKSHQGANILLVLPPPNKEKTINNSIELRYNLYLIAQSQSQSNRLDVNILNRNHRLTKPDRAIIFYAEPIKIFI